MWPDVVNGLLEVGGGLFIILSIRRILVDKQVKGVSWIGTAFFMLWGYWNLFYYPHLDQWYSFIGGLSIVVTNTIWTVLLVYYEFRNRFTKGVLSEDLCEMEFPE